MAATPLSPFSSACMGLFVACCVVLASGTGTCASFEDFNPCLQELPGWEADAPDGMKMEMSGMKMLSATRTYRQGDKQVTVTVVVGPQAATSWVPYEEGVVIETPDGELRVRKIKGLLVQTMYNKRDRSGGITILLEGPGGPGDGPGAVLILAVEGLSQDEALATAEKFDWQCFKDKAGRALSGN